MDTIREILGQDYADILNEHFDEDTMGFIESDYSFDEIEELVEELEDDSEEETPDVDNTGKLIQKIQEATKKLEKYKKVLKRHIDDLQLQKRQPPFIDPVVELKTKEDAKKHVKFEAKQLLKLQEQVNPKKSQQFNVYLRKYKSLLKEVKDQLKKDDFLMVAAWGKWIIEQIAKLGPYGWLAIAIVIILIVIFAGVFILVQSEDDINKNGKTSAYGVNGEKFYGVRLIYEDKDKEKSQFVSDYEGYIITAISDIEDNIKEIDITLEISENYDYFADGESAQKTVLTNIATEVFKIDNPSEQVPATLTDIVGGIKYFGINEDLHEVVASAISNYINENDLYQQAGEDEVPSDIETMIQNQVKTTIATNVVRTEKLFVEDQIFKDSDDSLIIKNAKNYRAMIYMPKKDVTFNWFNFKAYGINKDTFKVYIRNGNNKPVELEYKYIQTNQYFYESSNNLGLNVSKFNYNAENKIEGSLAELGKSANASELLALATDEDGNEIENVYTYAPVGMQYVFETDVPFMFGEVETKVK